ncbi:MAG: hypothetical protein H0V66_01785 [Bdellovibrionales bacterium]|nr:hypothetical protein [Bdellovibrionales bacterium]
MKRLLLSFLFLSSLDTYAGPACISHRGSFKSAPGNSPQSLQKALDLNADGVEFDIRHTAGGFPILMHDKKLTTATHAIGRNCPLKTNIRNLNLTNIRDKCVLQGSNNLIKVPLLEEALDVAAPSGKFVFIELKDAPSPITEEIIHYYFKDHPENLRIISFRPRHIDNLRKMKKANWNFWQKVKGMDLDVTPWGAHSEYGTNIWSRVFTLRSPRHRRDGIETSIWNLKNEKQLRKFIKKDITFITTDEVALCMELKSNS